MHPIIPQLAVLLQADASSVVSVVHALTAACQNDYNCKWLAKHGTAEAAVKLLFSTHSDTVFEVLCLLYTMTTEEEARLAVGQACSRSQTSGSASAVEQLFAILSAEDAGGLTWLKSHNIILCCSPGSEAEEWF